MGKRLLNRLDEQTKPLFHPSRQGRHPTNCPHQNRDNQSGQMWNILGGKGSGLVRIHRYYHQIHRYQNPSIE